MYGLGKWAFVESGASLPGISIRNMIRNREMGRRKRSIKTASSYHAMSTSNKFGAFTLAERANLANRFFPNAEQAIMVTPEIPLLRCMHLASERYATLSEGNILSFFTRQGRKQYELLSRSDLPTANTVVTDIVRSRKGEHIAYTTLDSYVHYFHIDRIQDAVRFNLFHSLQPIRALKWNICSTLSFNMDDRYIFVVEANGRVSIFGIESPTRVSFQAHEKAVTAIGSSRINPNIFYTASHDCLWKLWDSRSNTTGIPAPLINACSYSVANIDNDNQDNYLITTSTCGRRIDAWDLRFVEREICQVYRQHNNTAFHFGRATNLRTESDFLWRARFSSQITGYRYIYSNSSNGYVYIFDINTGEMHKFCARGTKFTDCSWHPDNFELTNGTFAGSIVTYYRVGKTV